MTFFETLRSCIAIGAAGACAAMLASAEASDRKQLTWAGKTSVRAAAEASAAPSVVSAATPAPSAVASPTPSLATAPTASAPSANIAVAEPEPAISAPLYEAATPSPAPVSATAPAPAPEIAPQSPLLPAAASAQQRFGAAPQAGDEVRISFYRAPAADDAVYLLRPGDTLSVQVRNQPDLSASSIQILPDGSLSLPRIGAVKAGGGSIEDLSAQLTDAYAALQLRDPEVSILVQSIKDPVADLFDTIGSGPNGAAVDILVPPSGIVSLPGLPRFDGFQPLPVWRDAIEGAVASAYGPGVMVAVNFAERANDRIYVMGEVNEPGAIDLRDGRDALSAVAAAGGVLRTAARSKVFVIRRGETGAEARGYDLGALLDAEFGDKPIRLAAGDVVVVPPTRIAKVNTAVSQYIRGILPIDLGVGIEIQE